MPFDALPEKPDPILTILTTARAEIADPKRWCKQSFEKGGAVCAMGAIGHAAGVRGEGWIATLFTYSLTKPPAYQAMEILARVVPPEYGVEELWGILSRLNGPSKVAYYNNAPGTTHADVVAWFDRAIAARVTELISAATPTERTSHAVRCTTNDRPEAARHAASRGYRNTNQTAQARDAIEATAD